MIEKVNGMVLAMASHPYLFLANQVNHASCYLFDGVRYIDLLMFERQRLPEQTSAKHKNIYQQLHFKLWNRYGIWSFSVTSRVSKMPELETAKRKKKRRFKKKIWTKRLTAQQLQENSVKMQKYDEIKEKYDGAIYSGAAIDSRYDAASYQFWTNFVQIE